MIENIVMPIPPAGEQRRVVGKVNSLFARTRRVRDELNNVPHLIESYKQAILAAAFSHWLEGEETLEYQPLKELVDSERGIPYGIVQTGKHSSDGVPTVRAGDIKAFQIDKDGLKLVDPKISDKYARTSLKGGEVLLSIRGTVGNAAVVNEALIGCNISREVAMIPVREELDPNYLAFFLASPKGRAFIEGNIKGVAQSGINLRDLRELPTPYCDMRRQKDIISRIKRAFSWINRIEEEQASASHLIDRLDQSILAKAFRGELVPQDPKDEPASVLLESIREERARLKKEKPPRKRQRRTGLEPPMVERKPSRRPIVEVISEHAPAVSPERLFQLAGFAPEDVDAFYAEIKQAVLAGQIEQDSEKNLVPVR